MRRSDGEYDTSVRHRSVALRVKCSRTSTLHNSNTARFARRSSLRSSQDPSSLASSFSLREALSQIPIEIMSTVLLKFYDGVIGVVPEDLFDDADAPLAVKSQAAILANIPRSTINIIYILLGSAAKPDVGACCAMTWKVICLLLFGNAGTLANKFFTNLTDISSNDDEVRCLSLRGAKRRAGNTAIARVTARSEAASFSEHFILARSGATRLRSVTNKTRSSSERSRPNARPNELIQMSSSK